MHIEAVLIALLISFLWGLSPVIHKTVLNNVTPHTAMVITSVFYTICTIVYALYFEQNIANDMKNINAKAVYFLAFTAIICGFITNVLYFSILKKYDSYIISALIYSCPVFTLLIAYLFLKEKVSFTGFLGVAFITAGVILLAFNHPGDEPFGIEH